MPKSKKQPEVYTLQRCHQEARALIAKYKYNKPDYKLSIYFKLVQQKDNKPVPQVSINYVHLFDERVNPQLFAYGPNPSTALVDLETQLQKETGLYANINLATEVSHG